MLWNNDKNISFIFVYIKIRDNSKRSIVSVCQTPVSSLCKSKHGTRSTQSIINSMSISRFEYSSNSLNLAITRRFDRSPD